MSSAVLVAVSLKRETNESIDARFTVRERTRPSPDEPRLDLRRVHIEDAWITASNATFSPNPAPIHHSNEILDHPIPGKATSEVEDLNLPMEPAHHSPEPEDSHMQDGPHPLSQRQSVAYFVHPGQKVS